MERKIRILLLDIETSPITCYTWSLWKTNISNDKIIDTGGVLCWSAKWYDSPGVIFDSSFKSGHKPMIRHMHRLLSKADMVVTYFGNSFDLPTLSKEFLMLGLLPPKPYKKLDLCKTVQSNFRFASSKLDFVCKALKIGAKTRHTGFRLWVDCLADDPVAWKLMEKYNRMDVTILERLYDRLKPWITSHPNHGAIDDMSCCPACGSEKLQRRGSQVAQVLRYKRYQCLSCGHWFRGNKSIPTEREERYTSIPT